MFNCFVIGICLVQLFLERIFLVCVTFNTCTGNFVLFIDRILVKFSNKKDRKMVYLVLKKVSSKLAKQSLYISMTLFRHKDKSILDR